MLIELWEKLRGYDKWIDVTATIESSKVRKTQHNGRDGSVSYTYDSGDLLSWKDAQGAKHYAPFNVDDESPLYQLVGGEFVAIRYNPAYPDRFYFPDLLRSRVRYAFRCLVYGLALASFLVLIFLFRFTFSH